MTDAVPWLIVVAVILHVATIYLLLRRSTDKAFVEVENWLGRKLREGREESANAFRRFREELSGQIAAITESNRNSIDRFRDTLDSRLGDLRERSDAKQEEMRRTIDGKLTEMGTRQQSQLQGARQQLGDLMKSNHGALDSIRETVDRRVKELQDGNDRKLEEMRQTVDEKLQGTLEQRLGKSFQLVSDRLDAVHRGLGEMQNLASGVGDLKRVLTTVKTRGTWAEIQLGAILEQILARAHYSKNVCTKKGSGESVEFAVRLPGPDGCQGEGVWLPIDSKFPQEDYVRIQEASERGDSEATAKAADALARKVRSEGQRIADKYLNPPVTTDIAIMYLATEGLYGEVV